MKSPKLLLTVSAAALATAACAEVMDRPEGLPIGERLTLRPYVSLSYTYDSNIDSSKHTRSGSTWVVEPGIGAYYRGENWNLDGAAWYQYHAYNHYTSQLNESAFGERLRMSWADSAPNEKGWKVMFSETFRQIAQDDDMSNSNGRGIGRDRKEFTVQGVVERRLNQYLHAAVDGSYYYLDYENNKDKYAPLYGWDRTTLGGEVGYAPSKWTDFIAAANYQWYRQDNTKNKDASYNRSQTRSDKTIKNDSRGWTIMGGIGTRATERVEYRLLAGWSRFEYGNAKTMSGWTYQVSARWQLEDRLSLMLLGSSYYQPSETYYGSANKTYTFSAGLAQSFVRGKLTGTLDLNYRREQTEYSEYASNDYDQDIWTGRVGLNYSLNRFLTMFGHLEYQWMDCERNDYEYDRWRATLGMRLSY